MNSPLSLLKRANQIRMLVLIVLCWHATVSAESFQLVTGEFAPYSGKGLPNGGLITEIINQAFQSMEHDTVIAFEPWKRGYFNTLTSKYFGTFPYVITKKRSERFTYSDPIYTAKLRWFVGDDLDIKYTKDEDLKGLRACAPLGYSHEEIQRFIDKKIVEIVRPKGDKECFKLIKMGRVHLYAVNEITGWRVIQEQFGSKQGFRTLEISVEEVTYHLMVAKDYPDADKWLNEFNKGLEQLKKSGELESIVKRHLGD